MTLCDVDKYTTVQYVHTVRTCMHTHMHTRMQDSIHATPLRHSRANR